ncbi:hypothetical protein HYDPIDRAFT_34477 [Hydnomerulius pinastri MD-312]|uniref:Uncharacterized protein n=1 Tax=Hydnomerulius pinastri MD-312 TaxID=994086 RepID=A0A0C9VKR0_9AGAM|nr:hypothetical protein HYDPIDRAFT_34477 [Hydnomerulius pinastri MD-312]
MEVDKDEDWVPLQGFDHRWLFPHASFVSPFNDRSGFYTVSDVLPSHLPFPRSAHEEIMQPPLDISPRFLRFPLNGFYTVFGMLLPPPHFLSPILGMRSQSRVMVHYYLTTPSPSPCPLFLLLLNPYPNQTQGHKSSRPPNFPRFSSLNPTYPPEHPRCQPFALFLTLPMTLYEAARLHFRLGLGVCRGIDMEMRRYFRVAPLLSLDTWKWKRGRTTKRKWEPFSPALSPSSNDLLKRGLNKRSDEVASFPFLVGWSLPIHPMHFIFSRRTIPTLVTAYARTSSQTSIYSQSSHSSCRSNLKSVFAISGALFGRVVKPAAPEDQNGVSSDFDDWVARQTGSLVIDMDIALVTVFTYIAVDGHSNAGDRRQDEIHGAAPGQ